MRTAAQRHTRGAHAGLSLCVYLYIKVFALSLARGSRSTPDEFRERERENARSYNERAWRNARLRQESRWFRVYKYLRPRIVVSLFLPSRVVPKGVSLSRPVYFTFGVGACRLYIIGRVRAPANEFETCFSRKPEGCWYRRKVNFLNKLHNLCNV